MWKHMSRYLLEFNGVFYYNGVPAIVTRWMPAGTIIEYLEERTDVNRLLLASSGVFPASGTGSLCILSLCSFTTWPKESGIFTSGI